MEESIRASVLAEFEQYKGTFVIAFNRVERLIGIAEDSMGLYYITWDGDVESWHSVLTPQIWLKGCLSESDYDSLIRLWKLNDNSQYTIYGDGINDNPDPAIRLSVSDTRTRAQQRTCDGRHITELYWDIR